MTTLFWWHPVVWWARRELQELENGGMDSVCIGNQQNWPYQIGVNADTPALMTAVINEASRGLKIPLGITVFWDDLAAIAVAKATGAAYVRGVFRGAYAGEMGLISLNASDAVRFRKLIDAEKVKLMFMLRPILAKSISDRDLVTEVKDAVWGSKPDAFALCGPIPGEAPTFEELKGVHENAKGRPVLMISDVENGRILKQEQFPELGEIFNPTWSPDGEQVAFSALDAGVTDLWIVDLRNGRSRQLTHDPWADLQPSWSRDGREIAFVTDRIANAGPNPRYGRYRLALIDVESGAIRQLPTFADGSKNISPQWSPDGRDLFFVSDHGGISNLYRLTLADGKIEPLTNLLNGVSGLTGLSPAVSVARDSGQVVFSTYEPGSFELFRLSADHKPGTGLAAEACVDRTIQGACSRGYRVYVLPEAVLSMNGGAPDRERRAKYESYGAKNIALNDLK